MVYFPVLLLVLICLYFILYKSALKLFKHSCLVVLSTPFLNTPLKLFKHSCLITAIFILFYFILFQLFFLKDSFCFNYASALLPFLLLMTHFNTALGPCGKGLVSIWSSICREDGSSNSSWEWGIAVWAIKATFPWEFKQFTKQERSRAIRTILQCFSSIPDIKQLFTDIVTGSLPMQFYFPIIFYFLHLKE